MRKIEEIKRSELVARSRKNPRYNRRLKIRLPSGGRAYNRIDMDKLFKHDIFEATINVIGETDNYDVAISFEGVVKNLKKQIKQRKKLDLNTVVRAVVDTFNHNDVLIHCSCPDFKYRFRYWATIDKYNAGDMEFRPTDITNPRGDLGSTCKHGLLLLNKQSWILKISSVINNYIKIIKLQNRGLYDKHIEPKLYGKQKDKEIEYSEQIGLFDNEVEETEGGVDETKPE